MIRKVDDAQDAIDTYGRFRNQILDVLALDPDTTENEILCLLDDRKAVMFADENSLAIVQIITQENEVWCLTRIAIGNLSEVVNGIEFVAEWSKNHGAIGMCICGRKGWKRVLKTRGFNEIPINTNKNNNNKNNEKAGLHLLGKHYGSIITKDDDPNHDD